MTSYEHSIWQQNKVLCGLDEAGRGPLAGPVVVAGVILKPGIIHPDINDSKKLSQKKRLLLFDWITQNALWFEIKIVNSEIIDQLNIYRATQKAMEEIAIKSQADLILSDAMPLKIQQEVIALVKGDQKSVSIAAASILAKVTRDELMEVYDQHYPGYGFKKHKGYPTKAHYDAIKDLGITPIHRLSYKLFKD